MSYHKLTYINFVNAQTDKEHVNDDRGAMAWNNYSMMIKNTTD